MRLFKHIGLKLNSLKKTILFVELSLGSIILLTASWNIFKKLSIDIVPLVNHSTP